MMKHIGVIGLAIVLVGGLANAAAVDGDFPGERYVLEITKEANIGVCECLDRYTVAVVDQGSGLPINALEVRVSGAGLHHEQYVFGGQQITPKPVSALGGITSPIDTTILLNWGDLTGYVPTEPLVPNDSCEPAQAFTAYGGITGYGSPLTGTVWSDVAAATPVNVLQVVLKCGTAADFSVAVSNAAGEGETFEGTIPEPATLGLLCLGGLALIRRRR